MLNRLRHQFEQSLLTGVASREDLAKIYGGNKMRVYQQMWEGVSPAQHAEDYEERIKLRNDLRKRFMSR